MKFPNFLMNKSFSARMLILVAGLFLMSITVPAQKIDAPLANAAADLDQCRNGGDGTILCTGSAWVNGNAGFQNSQYAEDQYIPYRMRFSNLTVGTKYTVIIGYDVTHSGAHAIDYLGTYNTLTISNRATNTATLRTGVDPCSGVSGCSGAPTSTAPITQDSVAVTSQIDPYTNAPIYQPSNQQFSIWGATGLTFDYNAIDGNVATDAQVERRVILTFTATVSNPVLAWSGHVAYGGDWGAGNSAGGISGSPYHMRLIGLCTGMVSVCTDGGNQDRSLSADAVIISGIINIVKVVNTVDGSGNANTAFPFTASSGFGTTSFSLIDDNAGPGVDTIQSAAITSFGAASAVTVTEGTTNGWTLASIGCTTNVASSATTTLASRNAVITTNAGGVTTCTFTNSQLTITAAPATITGQVMSSDGSALAGITLRLTDITTGEVKTATTTSFGYYTFDNLTVQDFYQLTITSKRYRFSSPSRTFTLSTDVTGMDFFCTSL
jgi:hypothetical protein